MKKHKIIHHTGNKRVAPLISFWHIPNALKMNEEIEIIPIDKNGKQLFKSEIRTITDIHPDENGIFSIYEATS